MNVLDRNKLAKNIYLLPDDKLNVINDFIDFLLEKSGKQKKIGTLEGIWENIGFEKLDIEKEVKNIKKELSDNLAGKMERWNI
jgi:hypothetical protein